MMDYCWLHLDFDNLESLPRRNSRIICFGASWSCFSWPGLDGPLASVCKNFLITN